ncbi:MAG: hypothetical protein PHQ89_04955 [Bacilli bacterium]|nr:hypothetical protein [Bacilli bacterium]
MKIVVNNQIGLNNEAIEASILEIGVLNINTKMQEIGISVITTKSDKNAAINLVCISFLNKTIKIIERIIIDVIPLIIG